MKDLLFKAYELGIQIRFQPITVEQYEQWVGMQGKNRYIITMLGRKLTAQQIAAVTRVVAEQGLNIDSILRLTGTRFARRERAGPQVVHRVIGAGESSRQGGYAVAFSATVHRAGHGHFVPEGRHGSAVRAGLSVSIWTRR